MAEGAEEAVYVNWVRFAVGPFDLRMDFGYRGPESQEEEPDLVPKVALVMSLSHAKSMLPLLAKMIADYEVQAAGSVPAPGFDQFGKQ